MNDGTLSPENTKLSSGYIFCFNHQIHLSASHKCVVEVNSSYIFTQIVPCIHQNQNWRNRNSDILMNMLENIGKSLLSLNAYIPIWQIFWITHNNTQRPSMIRCNIFHESLAKSTLEVELHQRFSDLSLHWRWCTTVLYIWNASGSSRSWAIFSRILCLSPLKMANNDPLTDEYSLKQYFFCYCLPDSKQKLFSDLQI